ncbi:MAG TPA: glycosyltransferase family 39 protein [Candidatus Sulfotelmatobacter sp.]|nr:glycosyltransferase family 39 protein [Candidatus Sulfotelmatobacter sp.]
MNANDYTPSVGAGSAVVQPPAILAWLRQIARGRTADPFWARPALAGSALLAAALYVINLTVSGYANTYYAAAALAASKSWSAWFFGSFDAANFITIDKPPLALWVMGLSVRLFGLSSWSILLPQALAGVATVVLLWLAVRRSFGPAAATIAAVVMALTPAAVLIFRFDNPDAVLTLLLVAAAYAFLRGLENGHIRWLALAGGLVGSAFLTKYLQAYLVLPAFAATYAIAGRGTVRRRLAVLLVSGTAVLVASGWWVAIVQAIPAADRPYIGGSTNDSVLDLIFGYDGLGRIFGGSGNPGGTGGAGGGGFSGTPGLLRLFNAQLGGQISWFVPSAVVGLVGGLILRGRAVRTDARRAGYLMWGGWFLVTAAVFSLMSGIIHSYYTVALAPAIAALVGAGLVDLWGLRSRHWIGGAILAATFAVSAWLAVQLLGRSPDFVPGVDVVILAVALLVALVVALPRRSGSDRLTLVAMGLGLAALLIGPTAYALDTMSTAYSGGDPSAGPAVTATTDGAPGGGGGAQPGGQFGGQPGGSLPGGGGQAGGPPAGGLGGATGPVGAGPADGVGGGSGLGGGAAADTTLVDYLVAHKGSATWIVAVDSSMNAGSIELASGEPVMAMGGFNGGDPAPTLAQFKALVASGQLRFLLVEGNGGGNGGPGGTSDSSISAIETWAASVGTVVDTGSTAGGTLYDLAAASTSGS